MRGDRHDGKVGRREPLTRETRAPQVGSPERASVGTTGTAFTLELLRVALLTVLQATRCGEASLSEPERAPALFFVTRLQIVRTKTTADLARNLNVAINKDDGNQVPRTPSYRRTDAWAQVLFAAPKHLSTWPPHADFFGKAGPAPDPPGTRQSRDRRGSPRCRKSSTRASSIGHTTIQSGSKTDSRHKSNLLPIREP